MKSGTSPAATQAPRSQPPDRQQLSALHAHFLAAILPRIETHARIAFRFLRCPGKRDDAVAETVALAWKWFLRLREQGKDVDTFVSTLATYAVRHVRSGRGLCGQEPSKDALAPLAQHRHGFQVEPLPTCTRHSHEELYGNPRGQCHIDAFEEYLRDNTITPPSEQAAFRLDFAAWLVLLGSRNREIALDMALGLRTGELAPKHKISQARVSQLRQEFHQEWQRFHGEAT